MAGWLLLNQPLAIFRACVEEPHVSFETVAPTVTAIRENIAKVLSAWTWLMLDDEDATRPSRPGEDEEMRTEAEILATILSTARDDARIRAVILNGSRANPTIERDAFQDFDIVYAVTEVESIKRQAGWIARFGEPMIVQTPDDMGDPPPAADGSYAYLMQFMDGHRIDLTLCPVDQLGRLGRDSLSVLLLDKDGIIAPFPPPSEADYLPTPPSAKAFADCCNEFWWVSLYVAKGLRRDQILYAKGMLDTVVREQAMTMLTWSLGAQTGYAVSFGKLGARFKRYLSPERWHQLLRTYADADPARTWDALFALCDLFRATAWEVAAHFDFRYPQHDDDRVSAHLRSLGNS